MTILSTLHLLYEDVTEDIEESLKSFPKGDIP